MKRIKALAKALWWLPICAIAIAWFVIDTTSDEKPKSVSVVEILKQADRDKVKPSGAEVNSDKDEIEVTLKNGKKLKTGQAMRGLPGTPRQLSRFSISSKRWQPKKWESLGSMHTSPTKRSG